MERKRSLFLRLLGTILGSTLIGSLIVIIVGFVLRWNTPVQFSNGFFVAGVIVIVLGMFTITSGFEQRADPRLLYAESVSQDSLPERNQRLVSEIHERYGALTFMAVTGLLLIVLSVAISKFL